MDKNFRVKHKNGHITWNRGKVVGSCGNPDEGALVQCKGITYKATESDHYGPIYTKTDHWQGGISQENTASIIEKLHTLECQRFEYEKKAEQHNILACKVGAKISELETKLSHLQHFERLPH